MGDDDTWFRWCLCRSEQETDDDDDVANTWLMAAMRVEQTADPTHFAPLCRLVTTIDRLERRLIAQTLDGIPATWPISIDSEASDIDHSRMMDELPAWWKPTCAALINGDIKPLLAELQMDREFDQSDVFGLGLLFWRMRVKRGRGRNRQSLTPSKAEYTIKQAARYVKWLQEEKNKSQAEAVDIVAAKVPSLTNADEVGGKLTNYLLGRRGSSRAKQRR